MLHADNAYHLQRHSHHLAPLANQHAVGHRVSRVWRPAGDRGHRTGHGSYRPCLGLDPLAVRRANYYADHVAPPAACGTTGSGPTHRQARRSITPRAAADPAPAAVPPDPPIGVQTTPYHQPVTDCVINALTDRLAQTCDYDARRASHRRMERGQPILKRGIALTPVKFGISFTLTHLNQAGALVHVYQDGSIHLNHGGTEMGQGLFQKVAQVAASRFGVSQEAIKITATDTAKVPNTSATAASSGSDLNGMAVQNACDEIRERIGRIWPNAIRPADITFADGKVRAGREEITFADAAASAYQARVSLSATGFYKTPDIEWDRIAGAVARFSISPMARPAPKS